MKYIVVYIFVFLLLLPAKMQAQKQFIDLIPSAGHQVLSETLIDTTAVNDSVAIVPLDTEQPASKGINADQKIKRKETMLYPSRRKPPLQKALFRGIIQPVRIMIALGTLVFISEIKKVDP